LLMRCGKHRQVLLGVRFKEARSSQKAFLHKLRIWAFCKCKVLSRVRYKDRI